MKSNSKIYSVMPGEPHLGRQRETTTTFDRDDIMEAISETFMEGDVDESSAYTLSNTDFEITEHLTTADIDSIDYDLGLLLDDDWGGDQPYAIVMKHLDEMVSQTAEVELDTVEYI